MANDFSRRYVYTSESAFRRRDKNYIATMKFLIPLVVLCTALFIVSESDAAPLPPSRFKLTETASAKEQQLNEWAKTFLSTYSKLFTSARDRDEISRDGSIEAGIELKQPTFARNLLSTVSKNLICMNDEIVN